MAIETTNEIWPNSKKRNESQKLTKDLGTYNPEQELQLFANWTSESIWVPPKDNSTELAKSMLNRFGPLASKKTCWQAMIDEHRSKFTHVREIEMPKASIRLPQGRLFVTVIERKDFDKIEDTIPNCVRTRLDEFLQCRGMQRGVKVYYLKPLCVEAHNQLIFTTREQLDAAIGQIQAEVYTEYRRLYWGHRAKRLAIGAIDVGLSIPRSFIQHFLNRKKREIDAYHAKLEFERRKRALRAARVHRKVRTTECTFDDMLALMDPPDRKDVIDHYVSENELSKIDRQVFLMVSATALPWFAALSFGMYKLAAVALATSVTVSVCDPAFVAEIPGCDGALFKIGHFDEVDGVMNVEI